MRSTPPRIAPNVPPQPSTSRSPDASPSTSVGGRSSAMRSTRSARSCDISSWFSGVVADVAGDVLLLEAADAVLEARACRGWPTAAPACRRAGTARSPRGSVRNFTAMRGSVVHLRDAPRLGAVGDVAVAQQHDRRHVLDRDAARLDRRVERVARAARGRRPAPATRRCGRTSPAAGRPARSWSACPCSGPRAGRSTITSGSSIITARPIASALSAKPGPLVVVSASAPA